MKKAWKWLRRSIWARVCLTSLGLLTIGTLLIYTGIIWPNSWFVKHDNTQGLDVSSYQKQIDWQKVAQTGTYSFVFIKATEGRTYQDPYFQANWSGARAQGLLRGAYHFYTTYLTGAEQANNYIHMVPKEAGMLPPVLDLEVTGADHQKMLHEIQVFLNLLEQHYGVKPIIYTDFDRYDQYVKGHFENYPIWFRNIIYPVQWSNIPNWSFWQYCDRGHVPGIPSYVDLNVFSGKPDQLKALALPTLS